MLNKGRVVSMEPALDVQISPEAIVVEYANVPKIRVSFYLVDIEVVFSKNPFMVSGSVSLLSHRVKDMDFFSFVQPFQIAEYDLNPEHTSWTVPIDKDLRK